jgi:hypothetical protein
MEIICEYFDCEYKVLYNYGEAEIKNGGLASTTASNAPTFIYTNKIGNIVKECK